MKIFKGNNLQEIGTRDRSNSRGRDIQETITEIETEIEGTVEPITGIEVEMTVEIEIGIDLIQEMEEEINKDLEQVKDTLTRMNSVTIVTEQVIQHIGAFRLENYLKRKGKKIVLHEEDDVQEIAQAVQDLNTKLNSLKVSNSTNY